MVVLASFLCVGARSVLRSYSSAEIITCRSLSGELEECFGTNHSESISYPQFHKRNQKIGKYFPTLAADIEKIVTLAQLTQSVLLRFKIKLHVLNSFLLFSTQV